MAIKSKCPFCGRLYNVKDPKADPTEFVGKCGTCRNCDVSGRSFSDCPLGGQHEPDDGCDAYVPDTIMFGMQIETLWNAQQRRQG